MKLWAVKLEPLFCCCAGGGEEVSARMWAASWASPSLRSLSEYKGMPLQLNKQGSLQLHQ